MIRLKRSDVEAFVEASKVQPGSLKHLYPEATAKTDEDAPEVAAEATGGNMAYEDVEGLDREAIGRGDVADA